MPTPNFGIFPNYMAAVLLLTMQGLCARENSALTTLSLQEAETLALAQDPGIARFTALADSLAEQAVADAQLPDPKFRFALSNFPVDTFNRDQEPMTQVQFGLQQSFPRGDSLAAKSRRGETLSEAEHDRAADQTRKTRREVRLSWLELFYWLGAEQIVNKNKSLFRQLVQVTQSQYAVGRYNQQDVIRAELELDLLDDRLEQIGAQQDKSRAELIRWVGVRPAQRPLPAQLPRLSRLSEHHLLEAHLENHPLIKAAQAEVRAGQASVALAREAYKPAWTLGVNYGVRGGEDLDGGDRADFLTAIVTVDLPVFRDKRQDRTLASRQRAAQAATLARDERLLELKQVLAAAYAERERLDRRITLYASSLLPQADHSSQAALLAYQNDTGEFTQLIRARITGLETQLKALRLEVDHAKVQAALLYLAGDEQ